MMAAIVVPLAWRSIERTVSCFETDFAGRLDVEKVSESFGGVGVFLKDNEARLFEAALRFTELDLLVAIRPSLRSTTASCAASDTSPAGQQGLGKASAPNEGHSCGSTHAPFRVNVEQIVEQSYCLLCSDQRL